MNNCSCSKAKYIPIVFILFIFNGCGLANITSLKAANIEKVAEEVIRIDHNIFNTTNFIGYNIYYKFYKSDDASTIQSDKNYITDSTKQPSTSILSSRNFKLIQIVTIKPNTYEITNTNVQPHIRPPREALNKPYSVYLDFSGGKALYPLRKEINDSDFVSSGNEFHVILIKENENNKISIIQRDNGVNTPKNFFNTKSSSSYSASDFDIKDMIKNFIPNDVIKIIFAVLPYGIDYTQGQKIYGNISISSEMTLQYTNTP